MMDTISPVILKRAALRKGVVGIDTTVKLSSGTARAFAPTWDMVIGIKGGSLSEEAYTQLYKGILACIPREVWRWLHTQGEQTGEVTVLCFCPNGKFCHTLLLMDYATQYYPDLFIKETP